MRVLDQDEGRTCAALRAHDVDQHSHRFFFGDLRRKRYRAVALPIGDAEHRCDKPYVFSRRRKPVDDISLELVEPGFRSVVAREPDSAFERSPDRVERTVDEERGALEHQRPDRLGLKARPKSTDYSTLADAGFALKDDQPTRPDLLDPAPCLQKRPDFLVAPHHHRQSALACRFEAAFHFADADDAKDPRRTAYAFQLLESEVLKKEFAARQSAGTLADDERARLRDRLQPGSEIHRVPNGVAFTGRDHDNARGDADANLQAAGNRKLKRGHRLDDVEPGANGAAGLALVRQRETKKRDDAVPETGENVSLVSDDAARAGLFVGSDDDLQRFRIEGLRQGRKPDQVAKQHRELAPLSHRRADEKSGRAGLVERLFFAQEVQDPLARSESQPDFLEIVVRQEAKRLEVDLVLLKDRAETLQIVVLQPFDQG